MGDLPTAARCIAMLLDYTGRHGLESWRLHAPGYQAILTSKTGGPAAGLPFLRTTLEGLRRSPKRGGPYYAGLLGAYAEALGTAGEVGEGLVAIDEALVMAENDDIRICVPEYCASRVTCFGWKASRTRALRTCSGRRSSLRVSRVPSPSNCARPRALPGYCAIKAIPPMQMHFSSLSSPGLPKGSRRLTSKHRRRFWTIFADSRSRLALYPTGRQLGA